MTSSPIVASVNVPAIPGSFSTTYSAMRMFETTTGAGRSGAILSGRRSRSDLTMHRLAESILDDIKRIDHAIGRTPVVRLTRVIEPGMAELWVKVEGMNPGGSIKDRTA